MKAPDSTLIAVRKDSYKDQIDRWYHGYDKYKPDLYLKEKSEQTYKQIKANLLIRKDIDGNVLIRNRHKIYDISMYYDDEESYWYDLMVLINSIDFYMEHKNEYVEMRYASKEICRMSAIHFIYNMVIWLPFFALDIRITPEFEFKPKTFDNKTYQAYINTKLIEPYKHLTTANEMSKIISRMYDIFIYIVEKSALYLGLSFSIHDIVKRWDDNRELYEINHTEIPQNMSIPEGEEFLSSRTRRFQEIMLHEESDNQLRPMLQAGQLSVKQLKEFAVNISYKPDLDGRTLNTHPKTNFISLGLRNPVDYATDASGGRKASNLALEIDNSGYLQRTLCKSAADIYLCDDPDYVCDTKHYFVKTISNKSDLDDMRGRYYLDDSGDEKILRQLTDDDYHLIGKRLKFRSPATCASKHGICKVCMGHLYTQNVGANVGVVSALMLTERWYQNPMSAKHILDTHTTSLQFVDLFYDFFTVEEGYRILLKEDLDYPENYIIKININEINKVKDIDNLKKNEYIGGFIIYNRELNQDTRVDDSAKNPIYFSDYLFDIIAEKRKNHKYDENGWISIDMDSLSTEEDIFFAQFENSELGRPLKELKNMIEKGKEVEGVTDISSLILKIHSLMKDGGIHTESVHVEVITRNLIRNRSKPTELPEYSDKTIDPIFISIHSSIMNNNSLLTGFTFERIYQQLRNPATYTKTGTSCWDRLFIN